MSALAGTISFLYPDVLSHQADVARRMACSLAELQGLSADWPAKNANRTMQAIVRHMFFAAFQLLRRRLSPDLVEQCLDLSEDIESAGEATLQRGAMRLLSVDHRACFSDASITDQFDTECYVLTRDALRCPSSTPDRNYLEASLKIVDSLGFSDLVGVAVDCIVHLKYREPDESMSGYTLYPLTGTVFTDWTDHPLRHAESLVHEASHSFLNYVMQLRGIDPTRAQRQFWSPWRGCHRPSFGIIHGAWAFAFVLDFYQTLVSSELSEMLSPAQARYCVSRVEYERSRLEEVRASLHQALADLNDETVSRLLTRAWNVVDTRFSASERIRGD